jgi:hypothetical protein
MWNLGLLGASLEKFSDYELITTSVLTSSQPSVTFSNLGIYASSYKHLQLRGVARVTASTTIRGQDIRFNGDSGSNYSGHLIISDGAVYAGGGANGSNAGAFYINGASNPSGAYGAGVVDILDAFSATKFKTVRYIGGQVGYSIMSLGSSAWRNTDAITSIQIYPQNSESYAAGSRFSLYGIKG